jgi:hypothetical protein
VPANRTDAAFRRVLLGLFLTKLRSRRFDTQGGATSPKGGFSAPFQIEFLGPRRLDDLATAPLRVRRSSGGKRAESLQQIYPPEESFACHAFVNPRQILIWCGLAVEVAVPVFAGGTRRAGCVVKTLLTHLQ